jgi:conjugative relaxase-like TrwC/TraI family protein
MAAFGSLKPGSSVSYYTESAGHRAGGTNYYTGASGGQEPPGRWAGAKAEALGLDGDIDPAAMEAIYTTGLLPDGSLYGTVSPARQTVNDRMNKFKQDNPDALPEEVREAERQARGAQRPGTSFVDYTFSPSKDITVLHTAAARAEQVAREAGDQDGVEKWARVREAVERITAEGNTVAVSYLEQNAGYGRTGSNAKKDGSKIRYVPGDGLVVGTFFQHTSRENDPQLHYHNPILNAVTKPDGKVGKLDTKLLYQERAAATAHGARYVQEKITEELGLTFHPRTDGNGHELDCIDEEVKDLFSERTKNITEGTEALVQRYVEEFGHEPPSITLTRMKKQESLRQRPQKPSAKGETRDQSLHRMDEQVQAEIGLSMARVAAKVEGAMRTSVVPEQFSPSAVAKQAVARCAESNSTFTASDVKRAVEAELPSYLGCGVAGAAEVIETVTAYALREVAVQVTQTVDHRLPQDFRHGDGSSAYRRPGSTRYASAETMKAERALEQAAVERGALAVDELDADVWLDGNAPELNESQRAAVKGILTSGAKVTALQGPAGAGKTYVLGVANRAWHDLTGGRMIGLAVSEQATDVLREAGLEAKNTAQFEAVQQRIAEGRASQDDLKWSVQANDILVPDEASMAETERVVQIQGYARPVNAKVVLAGDTKQLAAVGAGGAMDLVVSAEGTDTYELTDPRRFSEDWEKHASLDLRDGKGEVVDQYAMHDRIRDGGDEASAMKLAADLYVGDRLRGKSTVVVTATNAMAAAINGAIREDLVRLGLVSDEGKVLLEKDGNYAGVGDIVKPRKTTHDVGSTLRNQGRYVVDEVRADGSLVVSEQGNPDNVQNVPAEFRKDWLELGYAGTAHSTQGATVDTSITVAQEGMSAEGVYVGMSRGRERNTAVVVTGKDQIHPATEEVSERGHIDAEHTFKALIEADGEEGRAALTQQREDATRDKSMGTLLDLKEEATRGHCRIRTSRWLDELAVDDTLTIEERANLAADQGSEQLGRLLRVCEQAGLDPKETLAKAVESGSLEGAQSVAQVLHHRITSTNKKAMLLAEASESQPPADAPAEYLEHFDRLDDMMSQRCAELATALAESPEPWATEALGPVPEDGSFERMEWEERAGKIAGYREASGWTDEQEPLPHSPGTHETEQRAAWAEAWTAAGRPEANAEEPILSEGALRNRVLAMQREQAALPDSVFEEMQAVEQQIYESQQREARLKIEAEQARDELEAARVREQAAEAADYAERYATKKAQLQQVDDLRRELLGEQTTTRNLGIRAAEELGRRKVEVGQEEDKCTADEWLSSEHQARLEDDAHRPITETDLEENQLLRNEPVAETPGIVAADDQAPHENVPSDLDVGVKLMKARQAAETAADRRSADADRQSREALWQGSGQAVRERTVEFAEEDVAV